jgi:hypothetical protein
MNADMYLMTYKFKGMGTDFLKFQVMLRFALKILLVGNLKKFKIQLVTQCWHQERMEKNAVEVQSVQAPLMLSNFKDGLC